MEFDPKHLINLRELWVRITRKAKKFTLDSIGRLRSLQALDLSFHIVDSGSFPTLQPLSDCKYLFQLRLDVEGCWKLPIEVHQFLQNLKYPFINAKYLIEDPMPLLEKLPNLTFLDLSAYCGTKLACSSGGFPRLEIL
ncbi:hypothetical protein Vadar_016241 [Vaccinium darrowii]|uniref:Uncharacterized protein n=1 Tax=Vaccinium darrowii TaxID=229202 RepID=A0ACB7YG48_9ERIC|nr:hypothetical protein Vadar_016241 [Vaccinium darrowii]